MRRAGQVLLVSGMLLLVWYADQSSRQREYALFPPEDIWRLTDEVRLQQAPSHAASCVSIKPTHAFQVQALLAAHQSTTNCSAARFARLAMEHHGIGSSVHTLTAALAVAYNAGRILVFGDFGAGWTRGAAGACGAELGLGCFFTALSKCTPPPGALVEVLDMPERGRAGYRHARCSACWPCRAMLAENEAEPAATGAPSHCP